MIRFSAVLVAVAIGMLVAGIAASELLLVYIAIALSAVALVALAIGVALKREELFGDAQGLQGQPASAGARPVQSAPVSSGYGGGSDNQINVTPPPLTGAAVGSGGSPVLTQTQTAVSSSAGAPSGDVTFGRGSGGTVPAGPRRPQRSDGAWPVTINAEDVFQGNGARGRREPSVFTPVGDEPSAPAAETHSGQTHSGQTHSGDTRGSKTDGGWAWLAESTANGAAKDSPATVGQPVEDVEANSQAAEPAIHPVRDAESPLEPGEQESEPPAAPAADASGLVTVVRGVRRYHQPDCVLVRFMPEDDIQQMEVAQAQEAGCTPCTACLAEE